MNWWEFRRGPLARLGGQSMGRTKSGCGNGIFGLGERGGGISAQPPVTRSRVTEQADASQAYVAEGQAAAVTSRSKAKSEEVQGTTAVFTVTAFRDGTERPDRLCNRRLWKHSKLKWTRIEAGPVLGRRLDQSFFPTQIFIRC